MSGTSAGERCLNVGVQCGGEAVTAVGRQRLMPVGIHVVAVAVARRVHHRHVCCCLQIVGRTVHFFEALGTSFDRRQLDRVIEL